MSYRGFTEDEALHFWHMTALFGHGHLTYRDFLDIVDLRRNPAKMCEDIMGANPTKGDGRWDGRSDSEQQANIWRLQGWWD